MISRLSSTAFILLQGFLISIFITDPTLAETPAVPTNLPAPASPSSILIPQQVCTTPECEKLTCTNKINDAFTALQDECANAGISGLARLPKCIDRAQAQGKACEKLLSEDDQKKEQGMTDKRGGKKSRTVESFSSEALRDEEMKACLPFDGDKNRRREDQLRRDRERLETAVEGREEKAKDEIRKFMNDKAGLEEKKTAILNKISEIKRQTIDDQQRSVLEQMRLQTTTDSEIDNASSAEFPLIEEMNRLAVDESMELDDVEDPRFACQIQEEKTVSIGGLNDLIRNHASRAKKKDSCAATLSKKRKSIHQKYIIRKSSLMAKRTRIKARVAALQRQKGTFSNMANERSTANNTATMEAMAQLNKMLADLEHSFQDRQAFVEMMLNGEAQKAQKLKGILDRFDKEEQELAQRNEKQHLQNVLTKYERYKNVLLEQSQARHESGCLELAKSVWDRAFKKHILKTDFETARTNGDSETETTTSEPAPTTTSPNRDGGSPKVQADPMA